MEKSGKIKVLKMIDKAEDQMRSAELNISALHRFVQPHFDEEIDVVWTSDGATIVNSKGEIGFVRTFMESILNE